MDRRKDKIKRTFPDIINISRVVRPGATALHDCQVSYSNVVRVKGI